MRFDRNAIIVVVLLASSLSFGKIIYVDDDAAGANDGSSWQNAYKYLQDALTTAQLPETEKPLEIWVAQGTYKPNQGLIPIIPPSTPTQGGPSPGVWPADEGSFAAFGLIDNVTIKGGYAGVNEPDSNERDIELYKSILSGDLNGDDIKIKNTYELIIKPTHAENSLHVIGSLNNDANAVLDGFIITGGCNRSWSDPGPSGGGGMVIDNGSPTIINCTFTNNSVREYGGGILILSGSPTLINCTFTKNYADSGAGIWNGRRFGGIFGPPGPPDEPGNPTLKNCVFSNNYSLSDGTGMSNWGGNIVMSNCIFIGNFSESSGGGLDASGTVELNNCTFHGNWAYQESAIAKGSSYFLNIRNCIIWNGQNAISDINSSTITVTYSNIQGGWEGEGNIDLDPLFANPGYWADATDPNIVVEPENPNAVWVEGDYHLKSQAGRWNPNTQTWVQDDVTSPCIDAGDPNSPIGLEPFPNGGYINMGAYSGTSEASKSYFGKPECQTIVAGDINGDCKVDVADLEILMLHWLDE